MRINKKAFELPISTVIMLIIGITIFGLGIGLFAKISGEGTDVIEDLNNGIKNDLASLECSNDDSWICAPSVKMSVSDSKTFRIYVTNKGSLDGTFKIRFKNLVDLGSGSYGIENDCGSVSIFYADSDTDIRSGSSGSFPFLVKTNRVTREDCTFTGTVELEASGSTEGDGELTPVFIRVE